MKRRLGPRSVVFSSAHSSSSSAHSLESPGFTGPARQCCPSSRKSPALPTQPWPPPPPGARTRIMWADIYDVGLAGAACAAQGGRLAWTGSARTIYNFSVVSVAALSRSGRNLVARPTGPSRARDDTCPCAVTSRTTNSRRRFQTATVVASLPRGGRRVWRY